MSVWKVNDTSNWQILCTSALRSYNIIGLLALEINMTCTIAKFVYFAGYDIEDLMDHIN